MKRRVAVTVCQQRMRKQNKYGCRFGDFYSLAFGNMAALAAKRIHLAAQTQTRLLPPPRFDAAVVNAKWRLENGGLVVVTFNTMNMKVGTQRMTRLSALYWLCYSETFISFLALLVISYSWSSVHFFPPLKHMTKTHVTHV